MIFSCIMLVKHEQKYPRNVEIRVQHYSYCTVYIMTASQIYCMRPQCIIVVFKDWLYASIGTHMCVVSVYSICSQFSQIGCTHGDKYMYNCTLQYILTVFTDWLYTSRGAHTCELTQSVHTCSLIQTRAGLAFIQICQHTQHHIR